MTSHDYLTKTSFILIHLLFISLNHSNSSQFCDHNYLYVDSVVWNGSEYLLFYDEWMAHYNYRTNRMGEHSKQADIQCINQCITVRIYVNRILIFPNKSF